MNFKKIIIISGPTASGKTTTAISLAKYFANEIKMEIINFDSLYFYNELNIGSAKPTSQEQQGIKHHLIDISSIANPINAHDYLNLASPLLDKLLTENVIPILVGGSGFYLRALINGMYQDETNKGKNDTQAEQILANEGIEAVRERLKKVDLESFNTLHTNDHYRNVRALQYFFNNQKPLSLSKKEKISPYHLEKAGQEIFHIYLDLPKDEHFKIIEDRTQKMLQDGLISEIDHLLKNGFTGKERPLTSVGNKETVDYLKGEIKSKEELVQKISISTRQLAKAQRTFFKKITPKKTYHPLSDKDKILKDVAEFLKQKKL